MKNGLTMKRRAYAGAMRVLMTLGAALTLGLTLFLIFYVLREGLPNITWKLLSTKPSYLTESIGILPDILNTLYILLAALVIVLPLGVGAAIYLNEYAANKKVVAVIEYAAETLSGIPSIIYGLVGMLFFCQFLDMQTSLLAGALTLVIMNLPTVMRTTQESLKTVPQGSGRGSGARSARSCCRAASTASSPAASSPSDASSARARRCCSRRALPTNSTASPKASPAPARR